MRFGSLIVGIALIALNLLFAAKYKIKEIPVEEAAKYPAHQDFQNIVIGARLFLTSAEMSAIFDTDKLFEQKIMPVLIVIENNNNFAITAHARSIFLIDEGGTNIPSLPFAEVLLRINLKKPLSSYSTQRDILLRKVVKEDMLMDFEHKAFGEKLIAPHDSDHGIVFFPLPEPGALKNMKLYLPEIQNVSDDDPLMFFEFDLQKE